MGLEVVLKLLQLASPSGQLLFFVVFAGGEGRGGGISSFASMLLAS